MVCLFLLALPFSLLAVEHTTTIESHDDFLEVSITVVGADLSRFFDNLMDGMRARVEFDIRVSEPRNRLGRLFGDKFVRQFQPSYEAKWDPYDSRYIVTSHDGGRYRFSDEAALWQFFFTLPEYRIPWSALPQTEIVIETYVTYTPIVFVSPFAILSLLRSDDTESSEWARFVVDRHAGENP